MTGRHPDAFDERSEPSSTALEKLDHSIGKVSSLVERGGARIYVDHQLTECGSHGRVVAFESLQSTP